LAVAEDRRQFFSREGSRPILDRFARPLSAQYGESVLFSISVILPVYRTAAFLPELCRRLHKTLASCSGNYELLLIDDGSPDDAWNVILQLASADPHVKALRLSRNFGQHPAIAAGIDRARGDYIVLMDTDLQDRPEDIPSFLREFRDGIEIVYSTKKGEDERFLLWVTSRLFHRVFSAITRTQVPPNIGTFRMFTRRFLSVLKEFPERNVLYGPLMFFTGFHYATITVHHEKGALRGSAYTFRKRLSLAVDSLISYTDLPHRLLTMGGGLIMVGSALLVIVLLAAYLLLGTAAPPGLTLVSLLITFTLGAMMFGLGIIGTYVFRIFQEVLRRPRYLVADSRNFEGVEQQGERVSCGSSAF
jgi:glycosyltransferase involved in cell wall biosynthesis